jgi:exodeoxyribonuclease III
LKKYKGNSESTFLYDVNNTHRNLTNELNNKYFNYQEKQSVTPTQELSDFDEIADMLSKDNKNQTLARATLPRKEFQKIIDIDFRNLMIVQLMRKTRKKNKEIKFWILPRTFTISETDDHDQLRQKHIYFDNSKYWNNHGDFWDTEGYAQHHLLTQQEENGKGKTNRNIIRRNVKFDVQAYKPRILLSSTVFIEADKTQQLREILDIFHTRDSHTRVYISIMGTTKTIKKSLGNFLQKIPEDDRQLFKKRIVFYRNINTFKKVIETLNITHVIDTRLGYLKKIGIGSDHVRQCILLDKSKQLKYTGIIPVYKKWENAVKAISTSANGKLQPIPIKPLFKIGSNTKSEKTLSGPQDITIITWNTNSIRNVYNNNNLLPFLVTTNADIICITELRGDPSDILHLPGVVDILRKKGFFYCYWNNAKPNAGQYGTAIFSKIRPKEVLTGIGYLDDEGRVITAVYDDFTIVTSYTPTLDLPPSEDRIKKRQKFDEHLHGYVVALQTKYKQPVMLCGDLNTCIHIDDIWDKTLLDSHFPSCTKDERKRANAMMTEMSWTSAHEIMKKHKEDTQPEFTFFFDNRPNKGMKIDHFLVPIQWTNHHDPNEILLTKADILHNQRGSDHQPLSITLTIPPRKTTAIHNAKEIEAEQILNQIPSRTKVHNNHELHCLRTCRHKGATERENEHKIEPSTYTGIAGYSPLIKPLLPSKNMEEEVKTILQDALGILSHLHKQDGNTTPPTSTTQKVDTDSTQETSEYYAQMCNTSTTAYEQDCRSASERKSWIPHIPIKINNKEVQVMLDTGANNNLIQKNILEKLLGKTLQPGDLQPSDIFLRVGDTNTVTVLGFMNLHINIENKLYNERFYIMNQTSFEILLGNDFFHKHGAHIDYLTETLVIHKDRERATTRIPMQQKECPNLTTLNAIGLHTQEDTIIPPRSEMLLNTIVPVVHRKRFQGKFGEIHATNSLFHTHGCLTSEGFTFLKTKGRQNVYLMNTTNRKIRIPRGTRVANYLPTTPDKYCAHAQGIQIDMATFMTPQELHNMTAVQKPTGEIKPHEYTLPNSKRDEQDNRESKIDHTSEGGFKDIKPHHLIEDFPLEKLDDLYNQQGLKELLPNMKKEQMHVPGEPTEKQLQQLKQMLAKRKGVFSTNTKRPQHVKHYSVSIPHFGEPTVERIRPYTAIEVAEWKKHVEQLLESGTVEYSNSPWRSASFLVKKPSGGYRFVTDYRKANLQVPKMHWPLVRIDSALSALGNATIVSSCDANAAYHQIPLRSPKDKEWTSFAGPTCQLQYTTLPQGYRNSVSEYSKFTSVILGELQWQCCLTYLDDFLIWSKTFEDHIKDLDKVFCRLEYYGVQLSPSKSTFCQKKLPYLGHVIEPGVGVRPNPNLIKAIQEIPEPTTKKQVAHFVQKASFYRKMIPTYNKLISPLQELMNAKTWPKQGMTTEQKDTFQTLKKCLTQEPIIIIPDLTPNDNPFYVITDASKQGLAGILMQKKGNQLHPVMYISRATDEGEKKRYSTYQLEMAAIIWSLEVFKPYLRHKSIPFTLRTDCRSLCWLMKSESTYATKWIWKIAEFDFKIEYIKGTNNPADILSRIPLEVPPGFFSEQPLEPLYCDKHNELMQYIIDSVNKRADTKEKMKALTTLHSATNADTTQTATTAETLDMTISKLNVIDISQILRALDKKMKHMSRTAKAVESTLKKVKRQHIESGQEHEAFVEDINPTQQQQDMAAQELQTDVDENLSIIDYEFEEEKAEVEDIKRQEEEQADELEVKQNVEENLQRPMHSLDQQIDIINTQLNITNFKKWQQQDENIVKIIDKVNSSHATDKLHDLHKVEDGLLYISNSTLKKRYGGKKHKLRRFVMENDWSLYVPNTKVEDTQVEVKWAILRWYHGLPVSGHLGITGTYNLIRQKYYWPHMIKDVTKWIDACHPCQRRKQHKPNRQGEHRSVLYTKPFEIVSIDLVGPLLENVDNNKWILTIIDHFTRYPIAVAIPNKKEETVAKALKTHLFMAYPFWPKKIVSDRGSEFVNKALKLLYKQLGVKRILTAHDNAQANQVERFHKYMNAAIACFLQKKHRQILWEQYLDIAVYVYRCTVNNSTGYSPFFALYGRHPDRPLNFILNTGEEKFSSLKEYNDSMIKQLQEAWTTMNDNQIQMALQNTKRNDSLEKVEFNTNDNVWVWRKHNPNKMEYRFDGPHKITRKLAENSYEIEIAEKTVDGKTYKARKKNVSTRHLRLYKPFDDDYDDTSPSWIANPNEEDAKETKICEKKEIAVGMYCIIPHYSWHDIEVDDLPFALAQIEKIDKLNNNIQVRRFGNNDNDVYGRQLPGWIHITHRNRKSVYRSTRKDAKHFSYSSKMDIPNKLQYNYPIRLDWINYYGFQLNEDNTIPENILEKLSIDPDIPFLDEDFE